MIRHQEITCIICPIGCKIQVQTSGNQILHIDGEKCRRGLDYAQSEALDPRRVLTTSVVIDKGEWPLVSVKTTKPVPKSQLFTILKEIRKIHLCAPVSCGQVLFSNICDSSIDVVATKTVKRKDY